MPTYEYECQRCGHAFELFQSMTAKPLQRCPKCRGKVKRLMGMGAGILFKGSGFYQTDYRSESYRKTAKAESGGEAKSSGTGGEAKSSGTGGSKSSSPSSTTGSGTKTQEGKKA